MDSDIILYENKEVWQRLMNKGLRKEGIENYGEQDEVNRLSLADIDSIKYTWKYAQVNLELYRLVVDDLWYFRYRVFDWLGMLNTGRNLGFEGEKRKERIRAVTVTKVLSDIYLLPTFTDVRLLGKFLEQENFLETLFLHDLGYEVEPRGDQYLTLHFSEYYLPNRWDLEGDMYVTLPPQDWIISKRGPLYP